MGPPRNTALRLFVTCWIVFVLHFATNIVREHYPAFSLAERQTLRVDPYLGLHADVFRFEEGGAYINNNPGASLVGAVPYVLARPLIDRVVEHAARSRAERSAPLGLDYDHPRDDYRRFFRQVRERGLDVRFGLAAAIMQAFAMAPISAAAVVVMHSLLGRLGFASAASLALAFVYAFGTPVFFRTAFLNQNLLIAHALLFGLALLPLRPGERSSRLALAGAGALMGGMLLLDYSGLVPMAALGIFAVWRLRDRAADVRWLVLGAVPPVLMLLGYQHWAFGNALLPAQHYMPATEYSVKGWNGLATPDVGLLYANLFGRSFGLFSFSPLLLLAIAEPFVTRARIPRDLRVLTLGLTLSLWVFFSCIQFSWVQWQTGVRYLVPCIPVLFLAAADVLVSLPRWIAWVLASLAIFHTWCLSMARADAVESVRVVLGEGIQLPWLTSLGRAGATDLGAISASLPGAGVLILGTLLLVAAIWMPWLRGDSPVGES